MMRAILKSLTSAGLLFISILSTGVAKGDEGLAAPVMTPTAQFTLPSSEQPTPVRFAKERSWRFKWHDGRWWYWMPDGYWMVHNGNDWSRWVGRAPAVDPLAAAAAAEIKRRLAPLAKPMPPVQPGDWLESNAEPGQSFAEYLAARPVRRSEKLSKLYVCEIGTFTPEQAKILSATYEYLGMVFDVPVEVRKRIGLDAIPETAQRQHPVWDVQQIDVNYLLRDVLQVDRPADALAYTAFCAQDLWPKTEPGERQWNFVFGQASLSERVGAWSIFRYGDPSRYEEDRLRCLKRTLGTATHETGHILSIRHCTAYNCLMNGANSQEESDRHPLYFCPVCLSKLTWNLQVEPAPYLKRLEAFSRKHGLKDEADYYRQAAAALAK